MNYIYDPAGNRKSLVYGGTTETYTYGYQSVPNKGSRLVEVDPPAAQKPVNYMTRKEYRRRYEQFERDYFRLLHLVKKWANQGRDFDDDDLDFDCREGPLLTLAQLGAKVAAFNLKYGLDSAWWSAQAKAANVNNLTVQLVRLVLKNNPTRIGETLTREERRLINMILWKARRTDPLPPPSWVIGSAPLMAMSVSGTTRKTQYGYEANGNISQITQIDGGVITQTIGLVYDTANRLTEYDVDSLPVAQYYYNHMNQRMLKNTLTPAETRSFVYDLTGDMIREEVGSAYNEYIYLGGHRIAIIVPLTGGTGGGGVGCGGGCSVQGNVAWKSVVANGFIILLPAFLVVIIAYRANGRRIKGIALILLLSGAVVIFSYLSSKAQSPTFSIYWFVNDHLDTPVKIVDINKNVVNDVKLEPFGKVASEIGTLPNNFRFPGQYQDRENGLYYNWNRYYMPGVGRFSSSDPVNAESLYPYIYALNNPLINIDPDGLAHLTYCPPGGIGELCIESNVTFEGFSGKRCWRAHNITINNNMDPKVRKTPGSNAPAPSGTFSMVGEFFSYYNTIGSRIIC